jgi:hypothetical protein
LIIFPYETSFLGTQQFTMKPVMRWHHQQKRLGAMYQLDSTCGKSFQQLSKTHGHFEWLYITVTYYLYLPPFLSTLVSTQNVVRFSFVTIEQYLKSLLSYIAAIDLQTNHRDLKSNHSNHYILSRAREHLSNGYWRNIGLRSYRLVSILQIVYF